MGMSLQCIRTSVVHSVQCIQAKTMWLPTLTKYRRGFHHCAQSCIRVCGFLLLSAISSSCPSGVLPEIQEYLMRSTVVECLTQTEGPRVQASPASLRCGPWARHIYPSLVLVQPRKTCPYITERLLMGHNQNKQEYLVRSISTSSLAQRLLNLKFSCSTQLLMKFQLLIKTKMLGKKCSKNSWMMNVLC